MLLPLRKTYAALGLLTFGCLTTTPALAVSYGIYDARGLAMGGTVSAAGNTSQAQFYNPALLSFHDLDEDASRDGRVSFPNLVAQVSDTTSTTIDTLDDRLDEQLTTAISNFNTLIGEESASQVAAAARDLDSLLDQLGNKDLTLDAFVGFSVSEPSKREGGAFLLGVRTLGAATSSITAEDRLLLDDYILAMDSLAAGGTVNPALLDEEGNLRNPIDQLTSSGELSALIIAEWGIAFAHEFEFWGQGISFGVTPKMMHVDAYRDTLNFGDDITNLEDQLERFTDSGKAHLTFNADFGIAAVIADHFRVGLSVKDAFTKEFAVHQSTDPETGETLITPDIRLQARSRFGVAYVTERLTLGLDYDLQESTPLIGEAPSQDLSVGVEYMLLEKLALRVGYRQDQTGFHDALVSSGIGYQWRRAVLELSYAKNSELEAASLQFAWAF